MQEVFCMHCDAWKGPQGTRMLRAMDGKRIWELRRERGWRAEDLAERSGVAYRTIAGLESGENKRPQLATLEKLARALGVEVAELLRPSRKQRKKGEPAIAR